MDIGPLVEHFAAVTDADGFISPSAFHSQLETLVGVNDEKVNDTFRRFWQSLSGNGPMHISRLAAGFSVLCGGEADRKVSMAFSLFDTNGTGYIDLQEMTEYLTSVYSLMFEASSQTTDINPADFAREMAREAFEKADINHDGRISLDEFR